MCKNKKCENNYSVAGVMDDTAQKTISTVSTAADDDFSMEFFKDAVRYVKIVFLRFCFDLITLKTCV